MIIRSGECVTQVAADRQTAPAAELCVRLSDP